MKTGEYTVRAEPNGVKYAPGLLTEVPAGTTDAQVILSPSLTIAGRLLDGSGHPVKDEKIRAVPFEPGATGAQDTTNAAGEFRLEDLRPGLYDVKCPQVGLTLVAIPAGQKIVAKLAGSLTISGRISPDEAAVLDLPFGAELEATPLEQIRGKAKIPSLKTRIEDARSPFTFRYLAKGRCRITGRFTADFWGRRHTMIVKPGTIVKAGAKDVEIRLVFDD